MDRIDRALAGLEAHLTEAQLRQWRDRDYFEVRGKSGRRYRVHRKGFTTKLGERTPHLFNFHLIQRRSLFGWWERIRRGYAIIGTDWPNARFDFLLPYEDNYLAIKLALEADDRAVVRKACRLW